MKASTIINIGAAAISVAVVILIGAVVITRRGEPVVEPPREAVPKACEDFVVRAPDGGIRVVANGTCRPCVRGCLDIVRERLGSTPSGVALLMGCFDRCEIAGAGKMQLRIATAEGGDADSAEDR